jgi:hypothetical protein
MIARTSINRKAIAWFLIFVFCSPLLAQTATDYGYIKITSDVSTLPIYIDGGYVGNLPLAKELKVPVGKHLISFFDETTTSKVYRIEHEARTDVVVGNIMGGLTNDYSGASSAAARQGLAQYDVKMVEAGSQWVYVQPGETVNLFMDHSKVDEVAKAKTKYRVCVISACGVGLLVCIVGLIILASE